MPEPGGYRYPDHGDRVALAVIAGNAATAGWERQESAVLDRFDDFLRELSPRRRLLDFGSGLGRLALRGAGMFEAVTSYEPDGGRAREQRDRVAASPYRDRIRVVTAVPEDDAGYDAALCSHVVQHVPAAAVDAILARLARSLRPGGLLFLATTVAPAGGSRFTIERLGADGVLREDEVPRREFDAAAAGGASGRLPVRYFLPGELFDAVREHGLDPLAAYAFHGPAGVITVDGPDRSIDGCRDLAVVARRT